MTSNVYFLVYFIIGNVFSLMFVNLMLLMAPLALIVSISAYGGKALILPFLYYTGLDCFSNERYDPIAYLATRFLTAITF